MNVSRFAIAIVAAVTTVMTAGVAEAAYPTYAAWSTPTAGCQIASYTTAHSPILDATYGEVIFASGDSGTYHLVCPITNLNYSIVPVGFSFSYNDQGTGCTITGTVRWHSASTASFGTVATATATAGLSPAYLSYVSTSVSSMDMDNNMYWLDFAVTRTSSSITYCSVNTASLNKTFP
jgi:hypothetical protein